MAEPITTVHSPIGPVLVLNGRVPKSEAFQKAERHLRSQIRDAQAHLDEIENFYVTAERGSKKILTYEEMQTRG